MGENACIKSMGIHDDGCSSKQSLNLPKDSKTRFINNMRHDLLDGGAGGGGGASFVFLVRLLKEKFYVSGLIKKFSSKLNQVNKAVPLIVAGGELKIIIK